MRRLLLGCGILSSLLYVAMNVVIAARWPGYSPVTQTVSELSAIGAPTRSLWVPLGYIYTVLVGAFGWGVWKAAGGSRALRVLGALIVVYGSLGLFWPPMHLREALAAGGQSTTDTLHISFAMVTVALMLLAIGFGAAAAGRSFRVYSIATLVVLLVFGLLTGREAPGIESNQPTPLIGVWERINIGAFLLWVVVLATTLMRGTPRRDAASG